MIRYLVLALLAGSTQAYAVEAVCKNEATKVASKLDATTAELIGPFQGDNDEPIFEVKLVKVELENGLVETYHAQFNHQNEDSESWDFNYEIVMSSRFCTLSKFTYLGVTNEQYP